MTGKTVRRVRVLQHNCARSKEVMHSVLETAVKNADILLLQEPWIGPKYTTVGHPTFVSILPKDTPSRRPRVAIFYSRAFPRLAVNVRSDLIDDEDILALEVSTPQLETFTIFNVYNEQVDGRGPYTVERKLQDFSLPRRCLLAGDFNSHNTWWNSNIRGNRNDEVLVQLATDNNMVLLNEPDEPTHYPANGNTPSVLDLTFATPAMFDSISNWCIDPEMDTGSDHTVIRFEIASPLLMPTAPDPRSQRYNWKKADWEQFTKQLQATRQLNKDRWKLLIAHSHYNQNLDAAAELLRDSIVEACELHVPHIRPSPRSKVWWNDELNERRTCMKRHLRRWKENRTNDALREEYKRHRNAYFRAIDYAKKECWDTFLSEAKGKEVYTAFHYTKPRRVQLTPSLKATEDTTVNTFSEKAKLFRKTLFPPLPEYTAPPVHSFPPPFQWKHVSPEEIRSAIFTSSPTKAPGPDGLSFRCLRAAYDAIPEWFNDLYREVLRRGYHPLCWREATGAIIPKPNKPDYQVVKAYRIVALLNCLGKIAEKIVATRLSSLCESSQLLYKDQVGGRKQRSAIDAIMALTTDIDNAKQKRLVTSALFLDVKGAFDNVSRDRLLVTMKQMRFPSPIVNWVEQFMSKRTIQMAFDGQMEGLEAVETGIPQGSPVSPILFLIYLKPLFDKLEESHPNLKFPSYIDDVAIVSTQRSLAANVRELERASATAFEWARGNAVAFDDSKSELMHFVSSNSSDEVRKKVVRLPNGTEVVPQEVLRWLGVWLDRKLNFKTHVNTKLGAAERTLSALARLSTTERGLTVQAIRQLYLSCVVPISDFGSEIWWKGDGTGQQHLIDKLQKLQNKASRTILGAFRTTPIAALDAEAALLPPNLRLTAAQRRYALRILTFDRYHPVGVRCPDSFHQKAEGISQDVLGGACWDEAEDDQQYPNRLVRVLSRLRKWLNARSEVEDVNEQDLEVEPAKIHTHISTEEKSVAATDHRRLVSTLDTTCIKAYTDGSLLKGKVGTGVYVPAGLQWPELRRSFGMGETAEVFDAELAGVSYACTIFKSLLRGNAKFKQAWIFLDNTAAIRRTQSLHPGPGQQTAILVHNTAHSLSRLGIELHIAWVPGHEDVEGNEIADVLAKEGTEKPPAQQKISFAHLRRLVKQQAFMDWMESWRTGKKGASYHGKPLKKVDGRIATLHKREAARIIHMRTGHGYFNSYLARIPNSNVESPACPCGSRKQTAEHLLLYCKRYNRQRRDLRKALSGLPLNMEVALHTSRGLESTLKFLQETHIGLRPQVREALSQAVDSDR